MVTATVNVCIVQWSPITIYLGAHRLYPKVYLSVLKRDVNYKFSTNK